jgi:hypothetical protein
MKPQSLELWQIRKRYAKVLEFRKIAVAIFTPSILHTITHLHDMRGCWSQQKPSVFVIQQSSHDNPFT